MSILFCYGKFRSGHNGVNSPEGFSKCGVVHSALTLRSG